MPDPRKMVAIRLSPAGLAEIDKIAEEEGRSRSDVIRRLLSEALAARAAKALRRGKR